LALVKGLVDLHGGKVRARSEGPERGSRFTVTLPLGRAPAGEQTQSSLDERAERSVLIIEDNLDAAESLGQVLGLSGHRVAIACDGAEGVAKAHDLGPDIVLCDIGLPGGMDGYAVARALRHGPEQSSAFLVALTGYAQPDDQRRALEAGFDAHLTKPPDLETLNQVIARAPIHPPRT
jgi:two-component system CheB/CheR fusion protein